MLRTVLLILLAQPAFGQFMAGPSNFIPVHNSDGSLMNSAWAGGINAAHISMFDADLDGEEDDIFVFDKGGNRILIFTGSIVSGIRQYTVRPDLSYHFPVLKDWVLLRDYDCDGRRDIFTYSSVGGAIAVYRNISTTDLAFELVTNQVDALYPYQNSQGIFNIYISPIDVPAIVDFDGDGDLDILTFSINGTTVSFFENQTMDNAGNCGLDDYVLRNQCYGIFAEGLESSSITLAEPCSFNVVNPKSGENGGNDPKSGARHAGSTVLTLDVNQDGLQDIVLGDVSGTHMTLLVNSHGALGLDSIVSFHTDFPATLGGPAVDLYNFPAGFYEDFSGDGIRDLAVGVNNFSLAENKHSVWFYENLGENDAPVFSFVRDNFLQNDMIEHGEVSAPALFDYNGNGLMDLVIGARGAFMGGSSYHHTLSLYINTGTTTNPIYQLEDANWLDVSTLGIGQYVHPTFGDTDNDGDMDLVVGDQTGQVFLFENTAGPGNQANFVLQGPVMSGGAPIGIGQNSTPQLFDLNQDGKLDLIIGERIGNLNYYRNDGSPENFNFVLVTEELGGLSAIEPLFFIGSSSPHFFQYENETHLLLGAESGRMHYYTNIDGNIDGDYTLESLNAFGASAGAKSRPATADLNNDGIPEVLVGGIGGGILLFIGGGDPVSTQNISRKRDLFSLFPNPSSDVLNVMLNVSASEVFNYRVYTIMGQMVQSGNLKNGMVDVSALPAGLYLIEVAGESISGTQRWVKQ